MRSAARFPAEASFPVVGGLVWLLVGAGSGAVGFLLSVLPGCLLLAGGTAILLLPGDERSPQLGALGGALGLLLALPITFPVGLGMASLLALLSALGFVASGWTSYRFTRPQPGVPDPPLTPLLALELAFDEANLGSIPLGRQSPFVGGAEGVREDVERAHAVFEERGWLEKPLEFHQQPPPLVDPRSRPFTSRRLHCEELSFESGYTPRSGEPGGECWQSYTRNRTAYAWVLRHAGEPRPWLICIHGFGLGIPSIDLGAFRAVELHEELGLNLLFPVLPLHGPRKAGSRSGDLFMGAAFLNAIHAEAQAMWDIRRLLGWLREQGAPRIGVYGLSLGGYTASLLATLEENLDCVIAGIPATDLTELTRRIDSPHVLKRISATENTWGRIESMLRVISPLSSAPLPPPEARFIFGGAVDRIVPPDQVWRLWRHWGKPSIAWYAGGHISQYWHPEVRAFVYDGLRARGVVSP